MKYLHKITEAQLHSVLPFDHTLFELLHFEKLKDDCYIIHYIGPRPLNIAKLNELDIKLEETKLEV